MRGQTPRNLFIQNEKRMKIQLLLRRLAGILILSSLALGYFVSPYWFFVTAFVGLNLFQSSFTNFCPVENLMQKKKDLQ